jgi:peptide/nickel transport system substrate-binding protein
LALLKNKIMIINLAIAWQRWEKIGKFSCLFLVCVALVVGCQSPQSKPNNTNTPSKNRITIGTTLKQPRTLDPADTYEVSGLNIIYNVCDPLYTYELGTTKLKPLLAKAMPQVSKDGLTYTIPLRQGVTFHDGTPFNGKAMAFSLQRFVTNGGKPSFLLQGIVDSIKDTGDYEVTLRLKQPFTAFPALLAFPGACAVSPQAYKIGAGEFNPNKLIGTGPYKLVEFTSDSIRLDAFENYWGEKPANQGVDIQIYGSNPANLYNSFRTQEVDIAYQSLDPDQIDSLKQGGSQGKWQVIEGPGTAINYIVLNVNQKPLDRLEVRQAIAAIIDRSLINQRVLKGQGEPVYSLIPTAFDDYKPTFKENYGDGNFEKARKLLEKAGYSATNPVKVQIWHSTGSTVRGLVAQTLQALVEKELAGIIQFEPNSVEFATASSNLPKGVYPTFIADWQPDFLDADNYIQPFLDCTQGSLTKGCTQGGSQTQGSFYYSDRLNQLIDKQRQEPNLTTRKAIFAQIQDLLAQDVPYIPLWQSKDYAFVQNGISGVIINPSQNLPLSVIRRN